MKTEEYLDKILETSLDIGEKRISKIQEHQRLLELYGLTGLRTKHFLNSLLSNGKLVFLQLGVYRGAALVCGLYNNPEIKSYAVDDWHYSPLDVPNIKYEKDSKGEETKKTIPWPNIKMAAEDNLAKFTTNKTKLISKNWLDLKATDIPESVDILHIQTNTGTSKAETKAYINAASKFTANTFVLLMEYHKLDDVKNAVIEWVAENNAKVHSVRSKDSRNLADSEGWWGGLGCYVITKELVSK